MQSEQKFPLKTAHFLTVRGLATSTYTEYDYTDGGHRDLRSIYKACSKKDRTFAIKTLFYIILSTVPFRVVPSTGDTPFLTFLPLLECFLERTFCDGAQFSYRIFLNLHMFKKRPNFLNSAPTSIEGMLQLLSASSGRF
jgi:hypothetical protein